jgi:DNA-binding NarL/FixJ family response regulator
MMTGKDVHPKAMPAPVPPPTNQNPRQVRVLIVDDAPQVRRDLHMLLELSGQIEVVAEGGNGLEAIRLAAELSPEVVVMDLEMPGMDGYEATSLIKSRQLARRVIILSVHADPGNIERARAAGADGFVTKGDRYETLVNVILARNETPDPLDQTKGANL